MPQTPPPPAGPAVAPTAPPGVPSIPQGASPTDVWNAFRAQRSELRSQLDRLQDERGDLAGRLRHDPAPVGADLAGIEQQMIQVDARIADVRQQIAAADAAVARAAAAPGAVVPDRPMPRNGPPEELIALPILFILFVLFPLTLAYARRLWKRTPTAAVVVPPELAERLTRIEQAVDSVAVEVERIGEGQRFVSRLFAEGGGKHLGAGAAQPVAAPEPAAREVAAIPAGSSREHR